MSNRNQVILFAISITVFVLSGFLFWSGLKSELFKPQQTTVTQTSEPPQTKQILGEKTKSAPPSQSQETAQVTKVIDGDTIEVEKNGQRFKLRYIGVNTPETVDPRRKVECFGKQASAENKRLVENTEVFLEKDVSETDRFGRLLRYVYLKLDDGNLLFVNDYLVRQGFAYASSFPPDVKYSERFRLAQKEAEENRRGLWAECDVSSK
ncbi:thermonuclease family protein [Candidatus Daviesbacteria bacterium]|nr:thermonuclease family protein [Candidatus Daviesbacteria bacterium]